MDAFPTGLLIRVMIIAVTISPLVFAAVLLARRERRRAPQADLDARTNWSWRAAMLQHRRRHPSDGVRHPANDAEASGTGIRRRAA